MKPTFPKTKFTHADINEGDALTLKHRIGVFVVLQLLDGYRGVEVQHEGRDAMFVDVSEVVRVRRKLA